MARPGMSSAHQSSCTEGRRIRSEDEFSKDEEDLILRMYKLVGDRWSIIAGRIPGRNAEEIKKYCTTRLSLNLHEK